MLVSIFFQSDILNFNRKHQKRAWNCENMGQILSCSRCICSKMALFATFFLDFTLFHHFWSNFAPNIVNIGYFALKKMRRNSGEPRKMILSDGQSWHLRISKIYGSSGWNCAAPQLKHWKAPIDPKTIHRAEIHQHGPFWDVLGTYRSSKRTIFTLKCLHWEKRL